MKVRHKKKMSMDELVRAVWSGDINDKHYFESTDGEVYVGFGIDKKEFHTSDEIQEYHTFAVEVEEELTVNTEFKKLWVVEYSNIYEHGEVTEHNYRVSIGEILEDDTRDRVNVLAIFYGGQLIWSKEQRIPKHGVIEVEE